MQVVRFLVLYDEPEDIDAFERHYSEIHIPLAKKLPGLRRYSVGRNARAIRGGQPPYLIGELEWNDMDSLRKAFESPEGVATAEDVTEMAPSGVRSMIFEVEEV
jgi:uncharacterized protein (TIGR02118 family)